MRIALAALIGLTLVSAGQPRLFPLAAGNRWVVRDVDAGGATTISIRKGRVMHGFPGAGDLRVRRVGQTVQAWDTADRRWEAWFRFGVPLGTRYTVRLATTPLWQSVEVGVTSKSASVRDYHGKLRRGCTRFTFRYLTPIADAGLLGLSFCPGVGPVRYSETTIAGPRTYALAGFKIRP